MLFGIDCLSKYPYNWSVLSTLFYKPFQLISYMIYTIWKLLYLIIVVPITTMTRCFLQLVMLPINIPLYIISNNTIQSIIDKTLKGVNGDLIIILFQYSLVLFMSGILLGSIMGSILGFIHIHTYLKDHIFEFRFRTSIKWPLKKCYDHLVNSSSFLISSIEKLIRKYYYSTTDGNIGNDTNISIPITTKYNTTNFDTATKIIEKFNEKVESNELNNEYSPVSSIPLEWLTNFDFVDTKTKNMNRQNKQNDNIDTYDSTTVKCEPTTPSIANKVKTRSNTVYQTPPGSPVSSTDSIDSIDISIELLDSSTLPIKTSTLKKRKSRGKK